MSLVIESVRFEKIFYIWNIAVTYELSDVMECVMAELETKLESFINNPEDMTWLNMLGWEEIKQIIMRNGLFYQIIMRNGLFYQTPSQSQEIFHTKKLLFYFQINFE